MQRTLATIRPDKAEGHDVYDIPFAWNDGRIIHGVLYTSWLLVRPAGEIAGAAVAKPGAPPPTATIAVYLPARPRQDVELKWDAEGWSTAIPVSGLVSVVSVDDVPLVVIWELTAGKA